MTGVLSQEEIDQLLTAVNAIGHRHGHGAFENIEAFEDYLTERKFTQEKPYGIFDLNIPICRFFESKGGEAILADIERKNAEQNMGNVIIPNTKIKLINYSVCPKCKTVFSFKELIDYYKNPKPDPVFKNKRHQMREDTRVSCPECGKYFLPALVIADGNPKNEVQFLCRMQTVNAVENFFLKKGRNVLSKNKNNITREDRFITIRNDVELKQLESKPTLISNMLQYTPVNLISNLIDGSNVKNGDILFGKLNQI
jgi:ssDNA-binding Zn-finger/Zn-ribbon topoisomerase 1